MSQLRLPFGPYNKTTKISKYFWCSMAKSKTFPISPPSPAADGPKGNWAENRPETTDIPTNSSKAKKAYLRVKKSKELASNGKQIADNDLTEKDYIGNRITTNHPRQGKRSSDPTVQHKVATEKDPDLTAGYKDLRKQNE